MRRSEGEWERQRASPDERRVRALGDRALVDAMRCGDDWAFGEFLARFRSTLMTYARTIRVPDDLLPECVDEVLEDTAIELADPRAVVPAQLRAYLVGAVRRRHMALRRSSARRLRWYEEAAGGPRFTSDGDEAVVRSLCGESTVAASRGPADRAMDHEAPVEPSALQQLATAMDGTLDDETRRILGWLGHAVPHRQIAEWLGKSYDATTKQIWRLCRRLEREAPRQAASLPPAARRELERFFRRSERGRRPA